MDAESLLQEITDPSAHQNDHQRVYYAITGQGGAGAVRLAQREIVINGDRFLVQVTVLAFRHEQQE